MKNQTTESYWISSTKDTSYPSLKGDVTVDTVIIGGGITGITTAILLQEQGLSVALLEANRIGKGTTGYTTAKITSGHNLIYTDLLTYVGHEKAKQYADANENAIKEIHNLTNRYNIECDLVDNDSYVYSLLPENFNLIEKEVQVAQSLGLPVEHVSEMSLPYTQLAGIKYTGQAMFHPRKYVLQLAEQFTKNKGLLFENSRALDIQWKEKCLVLTNEGRVHADFVVLATHFPFYDKGFYFAKMYAESSYILGIKNRVPSAPMSITYEQPIRSLRSFSSNDQHLVLAGGESIRTGTTDNPIEHYRDLENFASELNLLDKDRSPIYKWSTQDYMTLDKVPYIGHLTPNHQRVFVATGFNKWGMTSGTVAAMIIKDLILKGSNPYAPVFSPSRHFDMQKLKQFFLINSQTAYEFIKGKLALLHEEVALMNKGEGRIITKNNNRYGVYKDEDNHLFTVDLTCPHLKCELTWNQAEKTWDCPCHGSRFNYKGEVIDGPSNQNLVRIDLNEMNQD